MATGYSQTFSRQGAFLASLRLHYSTVFNPSTNKSTVTVYAQFMASANYGNSYTFYANGYSSAGIYANGSRIYTVDDSSHYFTCGSATNSWATLSPNSGSISTFEITHNANGDASFTLGIIGTIRANYDNTRVGIIGSSSGDTITIHENAASTISSCPSSVETNGTLALTMSRLASTNYHVVKFYRGSSLLYTSGSFATSYSLTVPRTWFNSYPTSASLSVTVSVQTYNSGGTAIGSPATKSITVTADAGMKPSVSAGWASLAEYNAGAVAGLAGYIKGYSQAEASFDSTKIDMTAAVGASIASCSVVCQGETVSASPYRTPVLASTSVSVVCTVTDTRGRTASESFTLTVMDYANPTLTGIEIFRCDSSGNEDDDGTYYSAKAALTYSSLNAQNTCALATAYMAAGGSYGTETSMTSGTAVIVGPISADLSYTIRIRAQDDLGNTALYYVSIPTRKWAMKFRPQGNGVAFGKAAEYDDTFEIDDAWSVKSKGIVDLIYPVGSIYMSVNSTSPASMFGGTWTQIEDTFLLAAGQTYTAGATGGEAAHKLVASEIPAHTHGSKSLKGSLTRAVLDDGQSITRSGIVSSIDSPRTSTWKSEGGTACYRVNFDASHTHDSVGGNGTHNNMPPYLVVYMWKRTA